MTFGETLRDARERAGMSQAQLARLVGTSQPRLSSYEAGTVTPNPNSQARLLDAAKPLPSVVLGRHRSEALRLAARYRLANVRVFGSVAAGRDTRRSDIDLVVTPLPGASLLDLSGYALDVEELTGYRVDIVSDRGRGDDDPVLVDAKPL